jgi:hypothetical protein
VMITSMKKLKEKNSQDPYSYKYVCASFRNQLGTRVGEIKE